MPTKSIRHGQHLSQEILGTDSSKVFGRILQQSFMLSEKDANIIGNSARHAEVVACKMGEYAIEGIRPRRVARRLSSVKDGYSLPSGQIAIHNDLVDATEHYLRDDKTLPIDRKKISTAARKLMGAFELGRYVGYGIWHTLADRRTADQSNHPQSTAINFFHGITSDLVHRGLMEEPEEAEASTFDQELVNFYNGHVHSERFFSRAGVVMLGAVSRTINAERLMEHLRETTMNAFLGFDTVVEHGVTVGYVSQNDETQLPPFEDIGALTPLSEKEFLLSYVPEHELGLASVSSIQSIRTGRHKQ